MADEQFTFVGGVAHRVIGPNEQPSRPPAASAEMNAAEERLKDRREGRDFDHELYLPDPDEDARSAFRDERAAYQHREEQRAAAETERKAETERAEAERRAGEEHEIAETTKWTGGDEHIVSAAAERIREFNGAASQFMQMKAKFDANPELQTYENRRYLAECAQRLKAEQDGLQALSTRVNKAAHIKNAHARRLALQRDIPELKNDATRKAFVRDMARKHKVSPQYVESVTDEALVRREYTAWQAEKAAERETHLNRPRPGTYRGGILRDGGENPRELTVEQARDRLRRTGSMQDALQYRTLARERERERNG